MLITFEGVDGSGKSTQAKLLYQRLCVEEKDTSENNCILTREPGGTVFAEEVRKLLYTDTSTNIDAFTTLLLYLAARRDHYINKIKPALLAKKIVICDRFIDSTTVYQGYVMGLDLHLLQQMHDLLFTKKFYPDLTFVLQLDHYTALQRVIEKEASKDNALQTNIDYYRKICEGFQKIDTRNRIIHFLKADEDKTVIHEKIFAIVKEELAKDQAQLQV